MGLLSQLKKNEASKNEERGKTVADIREQVPAEDRPRRQATAESEPPAGEPCSACGSVLAWIDIYGGGPHCHRCRPWPSETFIRRLIGYDAVATHWRTIWPLDGSQDQPAGDRDSCGHSRTRTRVVWPAKERPDRRTGQAILVPDLDRWQEAEVFEECVSCGWWEKSKS